MLRRRSSFRFPLFFSFLGCQLSNILMYRVCPLKGLRHSLFIMGGGFLILATVTGIWSLVFYGGLFGIGYGMVSVWLHINIHVGAPKRVRRKLLSGLHSMYALSALLAPLGVGYFYSWGWTWRQGFLLMALLPLTISIFFFLLKTERRGVERLERVEGKTTKSHVIHYIYVGILVAAYVGGELSLSTRLTLYAYRYAEVTPELSTRYLTLFFLLLFIGRIGFLVVDIPNWKSEKILCGSLFLSFCLFVCGLCFSPWFMSLCGAAMAPCFAVSMDYVFDVFKDRAPEAMSYVIGVISLLIVPMHFAIGWLSDIFSLRVALIMGPTLLLLSLVLLSLRERIFKENVRTHPLALP